MNYEGLEEKHSSPKNGRIRDLTEAYEKLALVPPLPSGTGEVVMAFAHGKGFTMDEVNALGTRVVLWGDGPDVVLAFPGYGRINGEKKVTAIKYRNLATGRRTAHPGSTFGMASVVGDHEAKDWFISEGETDGARLLALTASRCGILILPAGALTIREQWLGIIPRGADVYLAHDADDAGDQGAAKAARMLGASAIRLRPPVKDWCEWDGGPKAFFEIVRSARAERGNRVRSFDDLLIQYRAERSGERKPIKIGWGSIDADTRGISDGQVLGVAARTAVGKTWALNSIVDFLGRTHVPTLVGSLEMPGIEWAERQLAVFNDIAPEEVEKWGKGENELDTKQFVSKMEKVLVCDESVHLSELSMLLNEARDRLSDDVRVLVVDYLGLLEVQGRDAYERTSAIGKGLKQIAKAERVGIIVAMQLSRAAGDGGTEVSLEMLRDSGVLEESLDFLLGLWRPGKSKDLSASERASMASILRVAILKNRKGPEGRVVDLRFREHSQKVYEPV